MSITAKNYIVTFDNDNNDVRVMFFFLIYQSNEKWIDVFAVFTIHLIFGIKLTFKDG